MAASLAPGDVVLGKYRVERVIGQGGMGMVVAVRHTALNELFAMKLMLNLDGAAGKQAFERFLREARICASLKGEHVVKVQDVGELEDGRPYMVMEYLEGQDLASLLDKKGPLSVQNASAMILQACEALSEAHRLGIIHRDIKPPNMFLIRTPNGKIRLKLLDFGISKRIDAETKALTNTGAMMGSPLYMSPEQLSDPRAVGPQTDIWAMGVVLYELLTGKTPFDGEMIFQVIQEILNKKPDPASKHRPSLPVEVDKIIDKALRKDPKERYASITEFARDVRQLLQVNSVIAADLNVDRPSEPEVNIDIEVATFDAMGFGPTIEASSENILAGPGSVRVADTNKAQDTKSANSAKTTGDGQSPSRAANTHSDLTKSVAKPGESKSLSPMTMGVAAISLLVIGAGTVYLLQGGARNAAPNIAPIPETSVSLASPELKSAPPNPRVGVDAPVASAAPAPSADANIASSAAAPPGSSFGKAKPLSSSAKSTAPSATTTSTMKHEGLF